MIETLCKYEGKKEQRTTANMGERRVGEKVGTEEAVQAERNKSYLLHLVLGIGLISIASQIDS